MNSSPPYPIGPGQRTLAAIVFTDVVSFSRRMHTEEVATLTLLERDLAFMTGVCEKHAGSVLKTTGDGLLLYFSSAVQAVGCAIQMQQHFAARARAGRAGEDLVHRIGIHLGDVFVVDQDVLGDGVNIASRLQGEAEPGGICISQTVYDVVKNKLTMQAARLAPRQLKNIAEPIPVYRIVLEPVAPPPPAVPPPVYVPPPPVRRTRARKLLAAGALLVLGAGAAGLLLEAQRKHEEELARSRTEQAELGALLGAKGNDAPGPAAAKNTPVAPDGPPAAERIRELLAWVDRALPRYTRDSPLQMRDLSGAIMYDTKLFVEPDHRLYFAEGGAIRPRNLADLKPDLLGAVIVSALRDAPAPPPRGVVAGAEAFAELHGLAAMTAALRSPGAVPPR